MLTFNKILVISCCFILCLSTCKENNREPSPDDKVIKLTLDSIKLDKGLESKKVRITAVINGVEKELLVPENTSSLSIGNLEINITELRGLEQLSNVKYLRLGVIYSAWSKVEEYLHNLPSVEVLYLSNCYLDNLNLLKIFKKLKCLLIYNSEIMKSSVIDFSENNALEYFALVRTDLPPEIIKKNVRYKMQDHLQIKNIPQALQVINFAENRAIIFDDDFFKSLMSVKKVYIMNSLYTADFWNRISEDGIEFKKFQRYYENTSIPDKYPNVIRVNNEKDGEVDLPDSLKRDNLAKLELPEIY